MSSLNLDSTVLVMFRVQTEKLAVGKLDYFWSKKNY